MVGDGQYDVEAAIAAGVRAVWVSHGRQKHFAAEPWRTVANLEDLTDIVRQCLDMDEAKGSEQTCSAALAAEPKPLAADATIDQILDALDEAGDNLKDFVAEVALTTEHAVTGTSSTRRGTVWYELSKEGDPRMRINLPTKEVGEKVFDDERIEYMLDEKGVLWDRNYKQRVQIKHIIRKPGQPRVNLLQLGQGPFPLPIGQAREEVRKQFEVEQIKPDAADPKGTLHLRLKPKPGGQFAKIESIDDWVDQA